jgi:hypothetical protein
MSTVMLPEISLAGMSSFQKMATALLWGRLRVIYRSTIRVKLVYSSMTLAVMRGLSLVKIS